jgi:hypothetical protein
MSSSLYLQSSGGFTLTTRIVLLLDLGRERHGSKLNLFMTLNSTKFGKMQNLEHSASFIYLFSVLLLKNHHFESNESYGENSY